MNKNPVSNCARDQGEKLVRGYEKDTCGCRVDSLINEARPWTVFFRQQRAETFLRGRAPIQYEEVAPYASTQTYARLRSKPRSTNGPGQHIAFMMDHSSSSRARVVTMLSSNEVYEDIPTILPPLQDFSNSKTPFSRVRPSPLEPRPNDRVNTQTQTTPLSSRQKALAQAKPIDSGDSEIDPRLLGSSGEHKESGGQAQISVPPDPHQARKKAKLCNNEQIADFVHLPTPQPPCKTPKEDRLPPLRPIAELNEPPSGAARFPPITPLSTSHHRPDNHDQDHDHDHDYDYEYDYDYDHEQFQQLPRLLPKETSRSSRQAAIKKPTPEVKKQRVYTRERTKWTQEETEQLVQGLAIYGMGRWKHILDHSEFNFHHSRTHVDLKDRCRVLFPPNEPHKWARPMPEHVSEDEFENLGPKRPGDRPRLRKRKQAWTEKEDVELDKGFKIHGYQWERIAKDLSLRFDNRTGSNIRDRFRLKYPELWAEPRPAPIAPPPPRKPQGGTKGVGSRGGKGQRKNKKRHSVMNLEVSGLGEGDDNLDDIAGKAVAASKTGQGSDWLNEMLNEDWEGPGFGVSLPPPPVRWEDMALHTPIFDLG